MAAINIGPANPSHHAYVMSVMREWLLDNSAYVEHLQPPVMSALLDACLTFCNTDVVTAADDPDTVIGFINYLQPSTINFVFVRGPFRRKGLLKQMVGHARIAPAPVKTAFMPTKGPIKALAQRHGYSLRYRPYLPLELQAELLAPQT